MTLLPKAKTDIFFSNSVFIFLTRFFPVLAAFLVQIYYSRNLPGDAFGGYQNFWVQLYIFSAFGCAGVHVFVITYPPDFLIRLLYKIKLSAYFYFLSWILVTCLCFTWMQAGKGYNIVMPFIFLLLHTGNALTEAFLISFKSFKKLAAINLVYGFFFCYLHYLVLKSGFSLDTIFFYMLLLMIAKAVAYTVSAFQYIQTHKRAAFKTETVTMGITALWLHLGLYDFLQVFVRWIDKFVIGLLFAESISGIYFNGSVDIPFLPIILGAAGSAVLIQLANHPHKQEPDFTIALALRSSRVLSSIVFPAFFFFILYRYEIFEVFFTNKFAAAVPIFLASCLAIPIRAYSFTTVLQNRNKGALINIGAVLDLVLALVLVYPLYQWLGLPGIALSFSIATYAQALFYLFYTARALNVSMLALIPLKNWLVKLIVFALLFIGIHYLSHGNLSTGMSLTLGVLSTAIVILVTLLRELKQLNREDVLKET